VCVIPAKLWPNQFGETLGSLPKEEELYNLNSL
jgi:hypothetical protein